MVSSTHDTLTGVAPTRLPRDWLRGLGAVAAMFAPWPLRALLGVGFIIHGWPKLFDAVYHARFAGLLAELGVPAPGFMTWSVGLVEVFGGLALILGAVTGLAALLLLIDMVCAVLLVQFGKGFAAVEPSLLYIAGLASLLLMGAGPMSIDAWWDRRMLIRDLR